MGSHSVTCHPTQVNGGFDLEQSNKVHNRELSSENRTFTFREIRTNQRTNQQTRVGHRRRLHGGRLGRSPPQPENCGGDASKSPHRNFIMSPLNTAKRYSKNYECVIIKVKRCADFSLKTYQSVWRPGSARTCWRSFLERSPRPPSWI